MSSSVSQHRDFQRIVQRVLEADNALRIEARVRPDGTDARWADDFANEELLYLVVDGTFIGGSPSIESFAANEIADTDNDGLFEFVDAWERRFVGFVGQAE